MLQNRSDANWATITSPPRQQASEVAFFLLSSRLSALGQNMSTLILDEGSNGALLRRAFK